MISHFLIRVYGQLYDSRLENALVATSGGTGSILSATLLQSHLWTVIPAAAGVLIPLLLSTFNAWQKAQQLRRFERERHDAELRRQAEIHAAEMLERLRGAEGDQVDPDQLNTLLSFFSDQLKPPAS